MVIVTHVTAAGNVVATHTDRHGKLSRVVRKVDFTKSLNRNHGEAAGDLAVRLGAHETSFGDLRHGVTPDGTTHTFRIK